MFETSAPIAAKPRTRTIAVPRDPQRAAMVLLEHFKAERLELLIRALTCAANAAARRAVDGAR
jgi:hypothetical protein